MGLLLATASRMRGGAPIPAAEARFAPATVAIRFVLARLAVYWPWAGRPPDPSHQPRVDDLAGTLQPRLGRALCACCGRPSPTAVALERHPCVIAGRWPGAAAISLRFGLPSRAVVGALALVKTRAVALMRWARSPFSRIPPAPGSSELRSASRGKVSFWCRFGVDL